MVSFKKMVLEFSHDILESIMSFVEDEDIRRVSCVSAFCRGVVMDCLRRGRVGLWSLQRCAECGRYSTYTLLLHYIACLPSKEIEVGGLCSAVCRKRSIGSFASCSYVIHCCPPRTLRCRVPGSSIM